MEHFRKYLGTLISTTLPHQNCPLGIDEVRKAVVSSRVMLARYTSDSDIVIGGNAFKHSVLKTMGWWHCVRETPIDIDTLTAKQRYRVRRGLQRNDVFRASLADIDLYAAELYESYIKSLSDYPKQYKPAIPHKDTFISGLKRATDSVGADIWLCRDKTEGKIIGYAHTPYSEDVVFMSTVKLDPTYFKNEINAALVYELCRYYLNERGFAYICDGERNIRHKTAYQDFLVSVLGFRKAPCVLNIVYHPIVKPFIYALYPLRKIFRLLSNLNKLFFNIYCILLQEQCARESRINTKV